MLEQGPNLAGERVDMSCGAGVCPEALQSDYDYRNWSWLLDPAKPEVSPEVLRPLEPARDKVTVVSPIEEEAEPQCLRGSRRRVGNTWQPPPLAQRKPSLRGGMCPRGSGPAPRRDRIERGG